MTHHSRPDSWLEPRPYSDPSLRLQKYGRILPMEEPSLSLRQLVWPVAKGLILTIAALALFFLFAVMTP